MNKAFIREPDDVEARCPGPSCGVAGHPVGPATLSQHLPPDALREISADAWFCPNSRCPVGYYDAFAQFIAADRVIDNIFPKDPSGPICACFGVTADQVVEAARARTAAAVRELIARSQSPDARCTTAAANGQCCVGEVQRLYLRNLSAGGA